MRISRWAVLGAIVMGCIPLQSASAVSLDPGGVGQVLLYPYYTAQRGDGVDGVFRTKISLTNESASAKALRVRFMEGENSRTVLEFNLFLGRAVSRSGTVIADAADGPAGIITDDTSCVDPVFSENGTAMGAGAHYKLARFDSSAYQGDGGSSSPNRSREGHIEVIAMTDLTGILANAVGTNVVGMPRNCPSVVGLQAAVPQQMLAPTTGIRGRADIVNAKKAIAVSYTADALVDFSRRQLFAAATQPWPRLTDANDDGYPVTVTASVRANDRTLLASYPQERAIDAVSAALMATGLRNDYQTRAGAINSEWVISYPTKRYYTDPLYTAQPLAPFDDLFDGDSCSQGDPYWFDAAGRTNELTCSGFSMIPPPHYASQALCKATTVAPIVAPQSVVFARSPILGSTNVANQHAIFAEGWLDLRLSSCWASAAQLPPSVAPNAGKIFVGHPVVGFAMTQGGAASLKAADALVSRILPHRRDVVCRTGDGPSCQ